MSRSRDSVVDINPSSAGFPRFLQRSTDRVHTALDSADALHRGGARLVDHKVFVSDDAKSCSRLHDVEELTRLQEELGARRTPEPLVAGGKGLVDQDASVRNDREQGV